MKVNTKSWLYKHVLESSDITEVKVWNEDNSDYHWGEYTTTCAIAWALCRTSILWLVIAFLALVFGVFPVIGFIAWMGYNPFNWTQDAIEAALSILAAYAIYAICLSMLILQCKLFLRHRCDSHVSKSVIVQSIADWFNKVCRKVEIVDAD